MTVKSTNSIKNNQEGMVSITVTMIIMVIVTLIVISFALIVRREQRQSLDRQLSTQAFYAAETGVNDAVHAITSNLDVSGMNNDCSAFNSAYNQYDPTIDDNIEYSCVLINKDPTNLQYTAELNTSIVVPIFTPTTGMDTIRVSWQGDGADFADSSMAAVHGLPQDGGGTLNTPILRTTVISLGSGSFTRDDLRNNSMTALLYPNGGGAGSPGVFNFQTGQGLIAGAHNGQFINGNCNTGNSSDDYPQYCNVDIKVPDTVAGTKYYLRITPLYAPAKKITIQGFNAEGAGSDASIPLVLEGAQALVDVTGRAADVLRRIQVRVPIHVTATGEIESGASYSNQSGLLPEAALQVTGGICKLLRVGGDQFSDDCRQTSTGNIGSYNFASPPSP